MEKKEFAPWLVSTWSDEALETALGEMWFWCILALGFMFIVLNTTGIMGFVFLAMQMTCLYLQFAVSIEKKKRANRDS